MPGQPGNVVVGGHRTSKHRVFRNVDDLVAGDQIIFQDANGEHVYLVNRVEIVDPDRGVDHQPDRDADRHAVRLPSARLDPATHRRVRRPPSLIELPIGVMNAATDTDAPPAGRALVRPLAALLGGALVAFSLPPWGFWPLAVRRRGRVRGCPGRGPDPPPGGAARVRIRTAWMAIGMCWMWFLTVPGYVVTSFLFAGFHAAAAAIAPTGPWRTIGRPAAHTLVEAIRLGWFPFGGVPLATIGISQAGGPLLGVARVGGVILLTWIVFQVGCALAGPAPAIARADAAQRRSGKSRRDSPGRRRNRTVCWRCWRSSS